jgi:ribulose-phosphate 3-epimerase
LTQKGGAVVKIFPSLISSKLLYLAETISLLEKVCDGFHLDIMDFHFVPNLTWGPVFINALAETTKKPLQIHLMVDNPEVYIDRIALRPRDIISIHFEAVSYERLVRLFAVLRKNGLIPSLALNPETPIENVQPFLPHIDHVMLMSVHPGFSGQEFLSNTHERLQKLVDWRTQSHASFTICLDGGISLDTIGTLRAIGMEEAAIASAIFDTTDPVDAIRQLRST